MFHLIEEKKVHVPVTQRSNPIERIAKKFSQQESKILTSLVLFLMLAYSTSNIYYVLISRYKVSQVSFIENV